MDVDFCSLLMLAGFYPDDFGWFFDRWLQVSFAARRLRMNETFNSGVIIPLSAAG